MSTSLTIPESLTTALFVMLFVFSVLFLLFVMVKVFSYILGYIEKKVKKDVPADTAPVTEVKEISAQPLKEEEIFSSGELKLTDCDEQTAAMIMAIVSDKSGIPLSELVFKSIKAID